MPTAHAGPRIDRGRFTVARLRRIIGENFVPVHRRRLRVRRELADRHLRGTGIEIGALHLPLSVPDHVTVRYVDRMPIEGLRRQYPELAHEDLVAPDIVEDGEGLESLADGSQAFVIANHLLEHTEDPIGTLATFSRVLEPGGILYMAVPDKRHTFDVDRPVTELEHHRRDHEDGPAASRHQHFEEYVRLVEKVPEERVAERTRELEELDYSIHFHVWDPQRLRELIEEARERYDVPLEIAEAVENGNEIVLILRRTEVVA